MTSATLPSSRNLAALPAPKDLWKRCIALAALDMALCPDPAARYYSFDAEWDDGEHLASMQNGQGDGYLIGFSDAGVFVKGFAHESAMAPDRTDPPAQWPGMYDACPDTLASFRDEPALSAAAATFCFAWDAAHPGWQCGVTEFADGPDPDGSEELIGILGAGPEHYAEFAKDYYELDKAPLELTRTMYAHDPVDMDLVVEFAADMDHAVNALSGLFELRYTSPFPFSSPA